MTEKQWAACPFCNIINGQAEANVVDLAARSIAIVPLNPVTDGHLLFIPKKHVADAREDPQTTAIVMRDAATWAAMSTDPLYRSFNLITSVGRPATQTVRHLHIHIVPRAEGDGLPLPWTAQQEASRA